MKPFSMALSGETGSGKTTQGGQLAIREHKDTGKITVLNTSDRGGFGSIEPLVDLGVIVVNELGPQDDPWVWLNDAAEGRFPKGIDADKVGLSLFDSGTSIGEQVMVSIANSPQQIGTSKTQRFKVGTGTGAKMIGLNNENHYGLAQTYLLDTIWKSTWLERKGISVVWTFSIDRQEDRVGTPVVGPKLVGHALTPAIPKWFKYHFRLDQVPSDGQSAARHILYLQARTEVGGTGISLSNARYPLAASEELTASLEPADVAKAIELIEAGRASAKLSLATELGL